MNNRDILLFLLLIAFMYNTYELNKLKTMEKFTTTTTEQQINTAVKKIYLADVEAIRLLSNFAIQLSQGGTTVPGNVNFSGKIQLNNITSNIYPTIWSQNEGIAASQIAVSNTIAAMRSDKQYAAYISSAEDGSIYARSQMNCAGKISGNTISATNSVSVGSNVTNSGSISAGPGESDGVDAKKYNLSINSWHGIGFKDDSNTTDLNNTHIWFNVRTGTINCKALNIIP